MQGSWDRDELHGEPWESSSDEPWDEDELDEADEELDEADDTSECPYCGASIYDDAEHCPACGQYLSTEDAPRQAKPWWFLLAAILCLLGVLLWIVR